jgi:predicted Fe-Mo cluster-binding NifX family protein
MKIAITSTGETLDSTIDSRFGRCAFFAIYDTETKATLFLQNPAKEASEGAGPVAVQFVATQKVNKIISGEFGMKIKTLLENLNIEMITNNDSAIKVADIIKQYH